MTVNRRQHKISIWTLGPDSSSARAVRLVSLNVKEALCKYYVNSHLPQCLEWFQDAVGKAKVWNSIFHHEALLSWIHTVLCCRPRRRAVTCLTAASKPASGPSRSTAASHFFTPVLSCQFLPPAALIWVCLDVCVECHEEKCLDSFRTLPLALFALEFHWGILVPLESQRITMVLAQITCWSARGRCCSFPTMPPWGGDKGNQGTPTQINNISQTIICVTPLNWITLNQKWHDANTLHIL